MITVLGQHFDIIILCILLRALISILCSIMINTPEGKLYVCIITLILDIPNLMKLPHYEQTTFTSNLYIHISIMANFEKSISI